jgi:hypothetical protein
MFIDLSTKCGEWIAKNTSSLLTEEMKKSLALKLNEVVTKDIIKEEEANYYTTIIKSIPLDALKGSIFQQHLTSLCTCLQNHSSNQSQYLIRVFPVIPFVIEACPLTSIGNMLHSIFTNMKSDPSTYGRLHWLITKKWPEQSDLLNPYNAQQIFDDAISIASNNPAVPNMLGVLLSTTAMLTSNIVADDNKSKLAHLACVLWHTFPEGASDALSEINVLPGEDDVAALLRAIDPNNTEDIAKLRAIWLQLNNKMDSDELTDVARVIVKNPMVGNEAEPDLGFVLWLEPCSNQMTVLISNMLNDDSFNDDQFHRIWIQAIRHATTLGNRFFQEAILGAVTRDGSSTAVRYILDERDIITNLHITNSTFAEHKNV